jgi:predicted metal-dependent hydrolase
MKKRTVMIASEEVEVDIVRSSRRTVALYVRPGGTLLIRAPWYVPVWSLIQFINQKSSWVTRQREKLRDIQPVAHTILVDDGSKIPFLGREVTVTVKHGVPGRASLRDDCLVIGMNGEASAEKISAAVDAWYLGEAKRYLTARTGELAAIHSSVLPRPSGVATRKMKRRWGTCHSNGTIWLNRELIKKDPELIDYVIIHELCHLVHHNHGRDFYRLLGSVMPGYHEIRQKLQYNRN